VISFEVSANILPPEFQKFDIIGYSLINIPYGKSEVFPLTGKIFRNRFNRYPGLSILFFSLLIFSYIRSHKNPRSKKLMNGTNFAFLTYRFLVLSMF